MDFTGQSGIDRINDISLYISIGYVSLVAPHLTVVMLPRPSLVVEPVWVDGLGAWVRPRETAVRGSLTIHASSRGGPSGGRPSLVCAAATA